MTFAEFLSKLKECRNAIALKELKAVVPGFDMSTGVFSLEVTHLDGHTECFIAPK